MEFVLEGSIVNICKGLIDKDLPLVSNLSNLSSIMKSHFKGTSWCGFYLSNESFTSLYLGPFQGDVACTIIPFGKGVCGVAALKKETQLVPNVHEFAGHIACSSSTNSEIVVPLIKDNKVYGVIDLDSDEFSNYSIKDKEELEEIALLISDLF